MRKNGTHVCQYMQLSSKTTRCWWYEALQLRNLKIGSLALAGISLVD